ncbi:uncharacterized protein TRIADDRAFT_19473 [Trichoplax adhaerens]|uniref:3-ketoacyl-CoA thiolase, mitochondrial n=1 Tax=Trichoplax adhaerens TaxID=10228 RepID=B3RLS6_TRIAD|nr:hypothetical protein TRIADDRAFT_19473 [Trichoplax adhaerens]EDV29577.1 hypothetical protein TRIADDRAFT_19473 [Trichoplax adhaerens]|eukprot:XP_002108779.1 hypothetical protein TRIADDRAFT_19473 [Trichoplax adhaerens]
MALARPVYLVAAKRTAFGTFGGALKNFTATDLGVVAATAALQAGNVDPTVVDSVVVGNVAQTSSDGPYIARHVGLRSGVKIESPALTVNRLCGSGFQAIVTGVQEIQIGDSKIVLTAGAESMSQAPYAVRGTRFGIPLGVSPQLEDTLWQTLTDNYIKTPMGITAETLAEKYSISGEECNQFAVQSQTRWFEANKDGKFKDEIEPMSIKGKKGPENFDTDEHPRMTSVEKLAKLPPVFKKGGTVNAGNASGICDGAAAVILASEQAVKDHNLTPLARLVAYGIAGVDPRVMGIGPVPAIKSALSKSGLSLNDMSLVEVNEAFAPQALAVMKELDLNPEITNVNGGAISLGHPVGASGARIAGHLIYELKRRSAKYAIGSACIGGGQGIAVILENLQ